MAEYDDYRGIDITNKKQAYPYHNKFNKPEVAPKIEHNDFIDPQEHYEKPDAQFVEPISSIALSQVRRRVYVQKQEHVSDVILNTNNLDHLLGPIEIVEMYNSSDRSQEIVAKIDQNNMTVIASPFDALTVQELNDLVTEKDKPVRGSYAHQLETLRRLILDGRCNRDSSLSLLHPETLKKIPAQKVLQDRNTLILKKTWIIPSTFQDAIQAMFSTPKGLNYISDNALKKVILKVFENVQNKYRYEGPISNKASFISIVLEYEIDLDLIRSKNEIYGFYFDPFDCILTCYPERTFIHPFNLNARSAENIRDKIEKFQGLIVSIERVDPEDIGRSQYFLGGYHPDDIVQEDKTPKKNTRPMVFEIPRSTDYRKQPGYYVHVSKNVEHEQQHIETYFYPLDTPADVLNLFNTKNDAFEHEHSRDEKLLDQKIEHERNKLHVELVKHEKQIEMFDLKNKELQSQIERDREKYERDREQERQKYERDSVQEKQQHGYEMDRLRQKHKIESISLIGSIVGLTLGLAAAIFKLKK